MKSTISNINFGLLLLLTFLVIFSGRTEIGGISQVVGRAHLIFLHLPIGISFFLLLGVIFNFISVEKSTVIPMGMLFLTTVSLITATAGTLLQYEGYNMEMLETHKWAAYIFCVVCLISAEFMWRYEVGYYITIANLIMINMLSMITGHAGGVVTHGENFILQPLSEQEIPTGEVTYYEKEIYPIFKDKCISCHNSRKQKGGLSMVSPEALLQGGKSGPLWHSDDLSNSMLLKNIHLPIEDEEHMPPKEKPQLTSEEMQILEQWILSGAKMDSVIESAVVEKVYNFKGADDKLITRINTPFLNVQPIANGSPALEANFYVSGQYDPQSLENLLDVKEQLVSLNLASMPVGDEVFSLLGQFINIEVLVLNSTDITGKGIDNLLNCKNLESLAVANTLLDSETIKLLKGHPSLKQIYVWNCIPDVAILEELRKAMPGVHFDIGYVEDPEEVIALNVPQIKLHEKGIKEGKEIEISHVLKGVTLKYTIDGRNPDSGDVKVYERPIPVDQYIQVKARAEKEGWLPSDMVELSFFNSGMKADSCWLLVAPHKDYPGSGGNGLIDGIPGDSDDFKSGGWTAWRQEAMEAVFEFRDEQPEGLTVSYLVNVPSYIVHPEALQVMVSKDGQQWSSVQKLEIEPTRQGERTRTTGININLEDLSPRFVKLIIQPLKKLPEWHAGAGQRGWLFLDEVYFY